MAKLVAENGPISFKTFALSQGDTTIGRHPDCTITVSKEAGAVSRYHAQIVWKDGKFYIQDMESRNGTYVNNRRIATELRELHDGDLIRVCDVSFRFEANDSAAGGTVETNASAQNQVVLFDEEDSDSSTVASTILDQMDITAGPQGLRMTTSPEVRLQALLAITKSLGGTLQLDQVLPQVLNGLFKIFLQADRGFIVLKTEKGELIPRWSANRDGNDDRTGRVSLTIVKRVMDTRTAILSRDAVGDERLEMSESLADLRIRSMMCVPLLDTNGEPMGVLQLDTLDQRKQFQARDLEVLASVAQQAATAIDNARLHEAALKQQELAHDLELANQVQRSFLPQQSPRLPGYEFYSYYQAANFVGGDYFDYIPMPDGRTAVVVADVVGHGIAAAMMMAKLSAEAKYSLARESNPAKAIMMLNDRLSDMQVDRFVTLIMIVLDPSTHEVTIVNAGHMAPIWHKVDGSIEEPGADVSGLPIAIMDGLDYEQTTIQLARGESLTMYTDGINEAMDANGKMYSIERLRDHVANGAKSLTELGETIIRDVREFIGDAPQSDDMCMVSVARQ